MSFSVVHMPCGAPGTVFKIEPFTIAWLSGADVWLSWFALSLVGLMGYALYRPNDPLVKQAFSHLSRREGCCAR